MLKLAQTKSLKLLTLTSIFFDKIQIILTFFDKIRIILTYFKLKILRN